ncbi:MAG: LysR family transcriptional regulator [candidate division NC10 bacterium]|nr:LysR family transcriptional regulator [candidate division NC10 bacterium]
MNIAVLNLYCNIVRLHSFSLGASANQISQSAASQAIQQLEGELGVRLIDRSKRPFMLTAEGQRFYDGCQELLAAYDRLRASLVHHRAQIAGIARVAAIYSVGIHIMSDQVRRFMALYPQAKVLLEYLHPHKVVEAVLSDEADLGIVSYPPKNRSLTVIPWRTEEMVFVCYPTHRLARHRVVTPPELEDEAFVAFDPDLRVRKAVDRWLRNHQARVNVVMEFDNTETIKQAISVGAGISILPQPTILKEVGGRTLAAIPLAPRDLVRPLGIIHRRGKLLPPSAEHFLELLRRAEPVAPQAPTAAPRPTPR